MQKNLEDKAAAGDAQAKELLGNTATGTEPAKLPAVGGTEEAAQAAQ